MQTRIVLGARGAGAAVADLVRETRVLLGWTQRELAVRARTSQSTVQRIETGSAALDIAVVTAVLAALGLRVALDVDGRHLEDRRRQRGALHGRLNGYVARRLERDHWLTSTEVQLGVDAPQGWIDLLGYRPADRSLLLEESKTEIGDLGALQRSLKFYAREAWTAAQALGWRPVRLVIVVVALDTAAVARRLADERDLAARVFPGRVGDAAAWLRDPSRNPPTGWVLATADPARRRADWLGATLLGQRRRPPAYEDYAEAAGRLLQTARR